MYKKPIWSIVGSAAVLGYLFMGVATQNPEWYPLGLVITYLAGLAGGVGIISLWEAWRRYR